MTTHVCPGPDKCPYIFLNSEFTFTCQQSGETFNQYVCDTYCPQMKGLVSTNDNLFYPKLKRDQQIKNSLVDTDEFVRILSNLKELIPGLESESPKKIISQLINLWYEFIEVSRQKKIYIHRRNRITFTVAIIYSLRTGIMNNNNTYIVFPHEERFEMKTKLNKKKKYESFKVPDIRTGTKMLKEVFKDHVVKSPILLYTTSARSS